jgi:phosphinothricin acetyltransferase
MEAESMALNMRVARHGDLGRIVQIYNETVASRSVTADTEAVTVAQRETWYQAHDPQKWPLWVATSATGHILGWLSLSQYSERAAYNGTAEISIYIDEAARGQHLGSQMVDYVAAHVAEFGITHVIARIISVNRASLALFAAKGYAQWGLLPGVMAFEDGPRDLVVLGKAFN